MALKCLIFLYYHILSYGTKITELLGFGCLYLYFHIKINLKYNIKISIFYIKILLDNIVFFNIHIYIYVYVCVCVSVCVYVCVYVYVML